MLKVNLYATYRHITGQKTIEVALPEPKTALAVLQDIFVDYPALRKEILTEDNNLQRHVSLFVKGRDIRHLDGLETVISEDQVFDLFPPVAGG